ncbi:Na+ channel, amiloride-sensitive family-containing protein [Strongyloides ratti]|uniref:Na+ channel, amiloride-sensitive family-containing protein n=1 Tax=Strongyloides ratti TaxID=34506 RepID=A0A090KR65_STRRB|nr:Na+ channel, amiloride-sensitive family-containing protein [Strongyloides ratti]CEF59869.1 Na+ channel, amiloride-sensitive family-containing protein [Strongyloides ratti]
MPSKLNRMLQHVVSSNNEKNSLNKRNDKRSQSEKKSYTNSSSKSKPSIVGIKNFGEGTSINSLNINTSNLDVRMATPGDIEYMDYEMSKEFSPSTERPQSHNDNFDSLNNPSDIYTNDDGEPTVMAVLEESNIDGIRHIRSTETPKVRIMWSFVITVFVFLAIFQIVTQMKMYLNTPVATNIEALYPPKINFPTVAICNNNQYRLTYLTGARLLNRKTSSEVKENNTTDIFDKALHLAKDIDAVKFLRNAAHWKSRMILKCELPNGTRCRISDFQAVWTLTGLCWAINTDPYNPIEITGAGNGNALKLLLNVERYERIENCNKKVRTESLPGLKILIYNQTDIPISSLDGVNVPPGYTMDIPFRMVHRVKIPGMNCIEESHEDKIKGKNMGDLSSIKACPIRRQMEDIEKICLCSMRRSYDPNPIQNISFCNVEQYFKCVQPLVKKNFASGLARKECKASCEEIDYIAWQDMNELPNNIFPKLIKAEDEEDEQDIDDSDSEDEFLSTDDSKGDEHFRCKENQYLDDITVIRIKREAQRAFEKQTRYQEDIQLRTSRLIERFREATDTISNLKWGWGGKNFESVYDRLLKNVECYGNMSLKHGDVLNRIRDPNILSEGIKAAAIYRILDAPAYIKNSSKYKTITDLKRDYIERVEDTLKHVNDYHEMLLTISRIYNEDQYHFKLSNKLERMERIKELIDQYENGKLQRRIWADKMQSRNMRHFFDEDLYDSWYNIIVKDLDGTILNSINKIEHLSEKLIGSWDSEENIEFGTIVLFGDLNDENKNMFKLFINDAFICTMENVKNETTSMLLNFRKSMQNFQSAYTNLFKKELPEYLENFEFGDKFIKENFAQVNVFLHKMNIEYWKQESTYSIWSLACDVGGALGLFLGASLLTIIELIYLCVYYGMCKPKFWRNNKLVNNTIYSTKECSGEMWKKSKQKIKNIQETKYCQYCMCCIKKNKDDKNNSESLKKYSFFNKFGNIIRNLRNKKSENKFLGNDNEFEFNTTGMTESQLRYRKEKNLEPGLVDPLLEQEDKLFEFQLHDIWYDDILKNKDNISKFAEKNGLNKELSDNKYIIENEINNVNEDNVKNENDVSNQDKKNKELFYCSNIIELPKIESNIDNISTQLTESLHSINDKDNINNILENNKNLNKEEINDELKESIIDTSTFINDESVKSSNIPLLVLSSDQLYQKDESSLYIKDFKIKDDKHDDKNSSSDSDKSTFV